MPNETSASEPVVALEVALQDFERMCKARRLKTDDSSWNEEEKASFALIREVVCGAIGSGQLQVDNDDDPVLLPTGAAVNVPKKIKLSKATGTTLLAMDGKIGGARQFAAYADMAGIDRSHFAKLQFWDVELLAKLFVLFFHTR
jgi:hypothetical protein